MFRILALFAFLLLFAPPALAAHTLTVAMGGKTQVFTARQLLANPAAMTIDIPKDAAYPRAMHYRAVPLSAVLKDFTLPRGQVLQAVATDGFTADLPLGLALRKPGAKGAVAWLAIEPPEHPWPKLPGKQASAGPFYIVWLHPEADDVRPEQWPYGIVKISAADSPAKRWPAIAIDETVAADSPVRAGQALFVTNCMVCHRLNGAGDAEVGPDLNLPENPVEYFRKDALHQYIRDPSSLRAWKTMGMKGFSKDALSDREVDEIIDYLGYMAGHKTH